MFTPSAASNSEVTVSREQKDQEVSNSEKISLRKASKGLQKEWKISLCLFFFFFLFSFFFFGRWVVIVMVVVVAGGVGLF